MGGMSKHWAACPSVAHATKIFLRRVLFADNIRKKDFHEKLIKRNFGLMCHNEH